MNGTRYREKLLIEMNSRWLQQAVNLLERMSNDMYRQSVPELGGQRVGPQLRHVIEFYESFLDGLARRSIDYDSRRRDPVIEMSRQAALTKLRGIQSRLNVADGLVADCTVWVRVEDSPTGARVMSSVARELQALSSHTVHHFALIGMVARMIGVATEQDFGVAPSTIAYWQRVGYTDTMAALPCVQ